MHSLLGILQFYAGTNALRFTLTKKKMIFIFFLNFFNLAGFILIPTLGLNLSRGILSEYRLWKRSPKNVPMKTNLEDKKWELLASYLANETSPEENEMIEQWLNEDNQNKQMLLELQKIWSPVKKTALQFDSQKSFSKLTQRIEKESLKDLHPQVNSFVSKSFPFFYKITAIAAVIALILIPLVVWQTWNNIDEKTTAPSMVWIEKQNPKGQRITLKLNDGTSIWLNAESKIRYPKNFDKISREVYLEGEAFFDVKTQNGIPFIIHTSQTQVKVLGTSFNVKAYKDSQTTETVVVSGKVMVAENDNLANQITLIPNEKSIFNKKNKKIGKIPVVSGEYTAWKDGVLSFNDETLGEAIQKMERWYGVEFKVTHAGILKCKVTASFKNPTLKKILESISSVVPVNFNISDKKVILSGNGC